MGTACQQLGIDLDAVAAEIPLVDGRPQRQLVASNVAVADGDAVGLRCRWRVYRRKRQNRQDRRTQEPGDQWHRACPPANRLYAYNGSASISTKAMRHTWSERLSQA